MESIDGVPALSRQPTLANGSFLTTRQEVGANVVARNNKPAEAGLSAR